MKKHFLKSFALIAMLFSALTVSAGTELFNPATTTISEVFIAYPDWVSDGVSSATYDANTGVISVDIKNQLNGQWKGQVKLQHDITFAAGKKYQCSMKFRANTEVNGVTLKIDDNTGMIFENQSIKIPANEDYVYTSAMVNGVAGNNNIIVFDFGWAPVSQISISDISIQEVEEQGGDESEKPEVGSIDWEAIDWVAASDNKYKVSHECLSSVVNVQQPPWAAERGIYVTAPAGISSCTVNGAIDGAGMILYLSSFTAKETEVTITHGLGSCTFWVYYADGTEGGGEGGEAPDPTPEPEEPEVTDKWADVDWLGASDNKYKVSHECLSSVVNVQQPPWAAERGIYVTAPAGISSCTVNGAIDGAGMILYLSSFTAKETEVTITHGLGTCTFWVYYADGTEGGSEGGEEPDPTPTPDPEVVESNYCQKTLTKEANSIDLTCEKVSVGNYRIIIEGSNLGQNGMDNATSGSFIIVNNEKTENITKSSQLKQYINTTLSTTSKVICEVPSTVDPKFDGNLFIMMPGEVNFGTVSDVIWGTCPEAEEDDQAPTMTSAIVESYTHNSAVIAVVAEDNIGVAKYQIVDAGNSVDQTLTATDGKITLSGLASATTYNLTIYAIDKAGNKSDGLPVAAFTTDALVYCDFPTGNNGDANFDNPNGRCLLTLTKLGNTQIRITVKPNYANGAMNQIDYLYVISTGGTPYPAEAGADAATGYDELSVDITYASAPTTYAFTILWSNPDWNGRWEINLNEILESNLCPLPTDEEAPVMVSASLVTGSETYNSAVLTVSATDNDEVANYHVIDATNGYDATIAPVGNQITLTGLTPSTSYNFTVTALDLAGNESENSKTVAVSTHKLEYCEWIIGSENRTDWADANRLCLLTISKITDKQLLVVAKPVSGANKLDFLQVQADGAPHQTVTSPAADELSIVLDFANTITEIPLFRILWSNEDVEENWMTDLKNVKASYLCPHIELGESVDLSKLDLSAGVTTDVKITRKFVKGSGKWNTLSLPFGLDAADIATAFGSAKVVELSGATLVTSTDIDLSVSNVSEIVAGKPYLIQIPASYAPTVIENITLSNTVTAQETATANGLAKMVSVLTPIAFDDAAGGIRFFLNTNGKLSYRSTTNGIMNPYRAYFEFPHINDPATASQVRARVVFNENVETGMDNLINENAPLKVIENGQLIIIRGGVKYNVQGQKL